MTGTSVYVMRGREVVLKRLDDDCLLDERVHPNIAERLHRVRELPLTVVANFIGVEIVAGEAQLVWEFVAGTNLQETRGDAATWERLSREVILAVLGLHSCGIVHGAIHGGNVIVTPAGDVKLTHVSPLLYSDPADDAVDVIELLDDLAARDAEASPLAKLLQRARGAANESSTEKPWTLDELYARVAALGSQPAMPELPRQRRRRWRTAPLIGAGVAALVGIALAVAVIWYLGGSGIG